MSSTITYNLDKEPFENESPIQLPSHCQIGDYVDLRVRALGAGEHTGNLLDAGKVIKVCFSPGKVTYDLEFTVEIDHENKKRHTTRIHNVDSAFVLKRTQDYLDQLPQEPYDDRSEWQRVIDELINRVDPNTTDGSKILSHLKRERTKPELD
jgi:hypothetical protein